MPKPVGVFCCDDLRASHLLAACHSLELPVPSDVAILGVDDDPVYCMFSTPRLSSVDPDAAAIGRTAATAMDDMLSDRRTAANPPNIVVQYGPDVLHGVHYTKIPHSPNGKTLTHALRELALEAATPASASRRRRPLPL